MPSLMSLCAPRRWGLALTLALLLGAMGCGPIRTQIPDDAAPTPSGPEPNEVEPAPEPATVEVQVYFTNDALGDPCTEVFPSPRQVPADDPLSGALAALLAGPDEAERSEGYGGWFSDETTGMLHSAEVVAGTVLVDLADLRSVIPGASSSCGSSALLAQLDATTLSAADGAASAIYHLDGEHDVFYEWLHLPIPGRAAPEDPDTDAAEPTDLADGRHPVLLHGADLAGRTLSVDVIQFLTGQDAFDAYRADHPGDLDGPPNDYYIVNANPRLRTLPVAADVDVQLVLLHRGQGTDLKPGEWETLLDDLAGEPSDQDLVSFSPFWLTLDHGVVIAIEEQYLP